jgi:hypothetical protein
MQPGTATAVCVGGRTQWGARYAGPPVKIRRTACAQRGRLRVQQGTDMATYGVKILTSDANHD